MSNFIYKACVKVLHFQIRKQVYNQKHVNYMSNININ